VHSLALRLRFTRSHCGLGCENPSVSPALEEIEGISSGRACHKHGSAFVFRTSSNSLRESNAFALNVVYFGSEKKERAY